MMGRLTCVAIALALTGCGATKLDREALLDPETCRDCHADHYREWSGSMHAYAADDPVFLAMNARGQRETGGALGDFCVQCHAPMAVREGLTKDGLNLAEVPQAFKGVTCYFCHDVVAVEGDHNNPLRLADDAVMRGGITNPAPSAPHEAAYSELHDRAEPASSALCGSCHDVITPSGVHLERTFAEWRGSLFAHETQAELQTCGRCHMPGRDGFAAYAEGVPVRRVHGHGMPGVDVAVTPWPQAEAQRALVQRDLDTTLFAVLCVKRVQGGVELRVDLENFAAGHHFPSGAAHDRRAWVELRASRAGRTVFETGVLADGQPLVALEAIDPNLWRMGDRATKADGRPAHMFWEVAEVASSALPAPTALGPWDPDYVDPHIARTFFVDDVPDLVALRVRIRPMGMDVLDDLVASGDLDPGLRGRFPTFTLGATEVVWTPDVEDRDGDGCVPDVN